MVMLANVTRHVHLSGWDICDLQLNSLELLTMLGRYVNAGMSRTSVL
jgi:hypothetical protein